MPHDHAHSHDHDHHHDRAHGSRLVHALAGLVGHQHADEVDDVVTDDAAGRRALWISLAILLATALLQGVVVAASGSVALLGDTLHNVADALTAVPLLVAFALARRPPSARFTYGYGRAEDLGGVFVVLMIALSAVLAAVEAVRRLLDPQPVTHLGWVAVAAVVGFVGNELVAGYRIRVGRRIGSAALVADGLHARTDGLTSLAVLIGAGGVALGWTWADPVVGLLITLGIIGILRSAAAQVGARLMDAVDPELVQQATAVLTATPGVVAVDEVRLRWLGHTLRAETRLVVESDLGQQAAHDVAHAAEDSLRRGVRRLEGVTVHTSPAPRSLLR